MAEHPTHGEWKERTARAGQRPRVLMSNRLVDFTTGGPQSNLNACSTPDGFDKLGHDIYIASPDDLNPKNHDRLKAILTEKVARAREMPFSDIQKMVLRSSLAEAVNDTVLYAHSKDIVEHFARVSDVVHKADYNKPEILGNPERLLVSMHDFVSDLKFIFKDDDEKLYRYLKRLYRDESPGGTFKRRDFEAAELEQAQMLARDMIKTMRLPKQEEDTFVRDTIVVKHADDGQQRLGFRTGPVEELHRRQIDEAYKDIDAVIASARTKLRGPQEATKQEMQAAAEVDEIAHRNTRGKPVTLAGYENPDLTIILETQPIPGMGGLSYSGQPLVRVTYTDDKPNYEHAITEELNHQGLAQIYNNNALPYTDDIDNRKKLWEKAIATDVRSKVDFTILGLPDRAYKHSSAWMAHKEIPVKVMQELDSPSVLRSRDGRPFNALQEMVEKVLLPDAMAYHQGVTLPVVGDDLARTTQHTRSTAGARTGWTLK